MAYNQIYSIVNAATQQALGDASVTAVDTSTLVDVGGQVLTDQNPAAFAEFVYGLMGVINQTRIKAKSYEGSSKVTAYRNAEDFGVYMRKIQAHQIQSAAQNSSYLSQDWDHYDGDLTENWTDRLFGLVSGFETAPQIVSKKKLARCFHNAAEMGAFISMLDTSRLNEITCNVESTEMLARATAMGSCFASANTVIDLGSIYNTQTGKATSPDTWMYDADFIRFAIFEMKRIIARLKSMNRIYNNYDADRFTEDADLVIDIHSDFVAGMQAFLNNTLIEKFIELPGFNEVSRWQGPGTAATAADARKMIVTNDNLGASATAWSGYVSNSGKTVTVNGVIAFAHDIDKYAHTINDLRTVTAENRLQEMVTTVTKYDTAWAVDPSEQGIVFICGTHAAS